MSLHELAEKTAESGLLDGFEFKEWPKTPRLFRDIVITEKIDGTNAAIHIRENKDLPGTYSIAAQSRKRLITPTSDNYGFAAWTHANAAELIELLGVGTHFGEWWGQGIQRRYALDEKRFSLFNTHKWADLEPRYVGAALVSTVPTLYVGPFSEAAIWQTVDDLRTFGSIAAPGFEKPEGVCVFHVASGRVFKVTTDHQDGGAQRLASGPLNDVRRDAGKWEAAA
jgi:hypothetical protein